MHLSHPADISLSLSYIYIYIYMCVCVCVCVNMKNQGIQRMILCIVEVFVNVQGFGFYIKPSPG